MGWSIRILSVSKSHHPVEVVCAGSKDLFSICWELRRLIRRRRECGRFTSPRPAIADGVAS